MIRRLVAGAVLALVAAAALVWWVLESSGVAIVETRRADGTLRRTHVWYAHTGSAIWLEAGRPHHPWYLDVQRDPRVVLRAADVVGTFDAVTVPGRQAHAHVRGLLREKYGLRDRILGWVVDTSPSIAVRLVPVAPDREGPPGDDADPAADPADPAARALPRSGMAPYARRDAIDRRPEAGGPGGPAAGGETATEETRWPSS